jgi:tRNA G18 (ribose-2'-O)-methylase SpoU
VLEVLLDNIRSIYNVGAIFRTADGVGIRHLHLCGLTATPEHAKVRKTALGAEQAVPWTYYRNSLEAVTQLKARGMHLWALESYPDARSLFEVAHELVSYPTVLVVGNEVSGVDPGILAQCHGKVSLPMHGVKESLNVAVAFGAAVYVLRHAYWQSIERHGRASP